MIHSFGYINIEVIYSIVFTLKTDVSTILAEESNSYGINNFRIFVSTYDVYSYFDLYFCK